MNVFSATSAPRRFRSSLHGKESRGREGVPVWRANRTGKAEYYRLKAPDGARNIAARKVDIAVVETVASDLLSPAFVTAAVKSTREKFAVSHSEETPPLRPGRRG